MKEKKYIIENQRELIFSYLSIGCIIGIVLFLITGGSDENKKFFFIINSIHISFIILLFFLHYFKKISTVAAIIAFALISQIEISVECIVMAIKNTPFSISLGEFYQFNLSSCIRQQNSLTAQFVSFSLSNLANIFYPPNFYNN